MPVPRPTTDADFRSDVIDASRQGPVLVDFWAPWCGPCRMVAPVLEAIAQEYPDKITIVKINTDTDNQQAGKLGISSIPTLVLYENGEAVRTVVGAKPKHVLIAELGSVLGE